MVYPGAVPMGGYMYAPDQLGRVPGEAVRAQGTACWVSHGIWCTAMHKATTSAGGTCHLPPCLLLTSARLHVLHVRRHNMKQADWRLRLLCRWRCRLRHGASCRWSSRLHSPHVWSRCWWCVSRWAPPPNGQPRAVGRRRRLWPCRAGGRRRGCHGTRGWWRAAGAHDGRQRRHVLHGAAWGAGRGPCLRRTLLLQWNMAYAAGATPGTLQAMHGSSAGN